MSMPHFYYIFDAKGESLGQMYTGYFSYFPVSRTRDKVRFDRELGGLIVTDLARYCAGKQEKTPEPRFKMEDVAYIKSDSGDVVPASGFVDCVTAYIEGLQSGQQTKTAQIEEAESVKLMLLRPDGETAAHPKQDPAP